MQKFQRDATTSRNSQKKQTRKLSAGQHNWHLKKPLAGFHQWAPKKKTDGTTSPWCQDKTDSNWLESLLRRGLFLEGHQRKEHRSHSQVTAVHRAAHSLDHRDDAKGQLSKNKAQKKSRVSILLPSYWWQMDPVIVWF
uniref:Uncharacterized protein n=1 Tax=Micrurus corallinus TaxID=54390 RepID=A0A2D4FGS2_MICCO